MLLALETTTNVCSVAFKDADGKIFEKRTDKRGSHSEKLFLFIEELMKEHRFSIDRLQAVLISEGPGSYTGLRIGASAVKGLLFQNQVPLYGINTLASFARAALEQNPDLRTIHSIIDARRVHIYHQQFINDNNTLSAGSDIQVIPIKEFETLVEGEDAIAGTGLARINAAIRDKACVYNHHIISGRSLIRLFEEKSGQKFIRNISPEEFEPRYYTSGQVKKE